MAKPDNLKYFDFHPVDSKVVRWCDHLINLYRVAVQRIPFISLAMSSATYVWIMIAVVAYLLRRHSWRGLAIWVPLLGVLAVCLIGPCNGSTYMRYLYPVIACMALCHRRHHHPQRPPLVLSLVQRGQVTLRQGVASSRRLHFGVYLAGQ